MPSLRGRECADAEEFYRQLKGVVIDDAELVNDHFQEWRDFYNCHSPHGSLGGQSPTTDYSKGPAWQRPRVNDLRQSYTRTPDLGSVLGFVLERKLELGAVGDRPALV